MKVLAAFLVAMVTLVLSPDHSTAVKHYAGEVPQGHSVTYYLNICSVCGEFYGGSVERECIMDKSFATFNNCLAAILQRRRK
ncbi:hypothetical protein V1264_002827 [Littorina saxatilis]|uniref:Uncharacterized protein n=1 Tax=Littorina saxatilis TaxID=31220 RepID=A0AAN9B4A1_9CAEN